MVVLCGSGVVVVTVVVVGSGAVVLGVLGELEDGGNRGGGGSLGISVLSVGIGRSVEEDIGVGYSWSSNGKSVTGDTSIPACVKIGELMLPSHSPTHQPHQRSRRRPLDYCRYRYRTELR